MLLCVVCVFDFGIKRVSRWRKSAAIVISESGCAGLPACQSYSLWALQRALVRTMSVKSRFRGSGATRSKLDPLRLTQSSCAITLNLEMHPRNLL